MTRQNPDGLRSLNDIGEEDRTEEKPMELPDPTHRYRRIFQMMQRLASSKTAHPEIRRRSARWLRKAAPPLTLAEIYEGAVAASLGDTASHGAADDLQAGGES
jgi:hypothetical protein